MCFLSRFSANMYVFAKQELADLGADSRKTVRRSVTSTVVGAAWVAELMPHDFSERSRFKTKPLHLLRLLRT